VNTHSWLQNKRVILGVTGGIACYKACELARELGRLGATVQVVMTEAATAFVTPLTFQALTGHEVRISLLDPSAEAGMGHIELARWADLIIVAPCTANTLANLACGQAPDLLSTLWLAATCPKAVAPAMNQAMWSDPATTANIDTLVGHGHLILGPAAGIQACGDIGPGRMLEPNDLIHALEQHLARGPLAGQTVMITAGPTHEPLDPVRYLANRSSGKMGFALAAEAARLGGRVILITGPVHLDAPRGMACVRVETADQMLEAVLRDLSGVDLFIGAAAVCDVRPVRPSEEKLKKSKDDLSSLALAENPDIIQCVATHPNRPVTVIGFAAETSDLDAHAREKLDRKGLDWIIANDVSLGQVFAKDQTSCCLIGHSPETIHFTGTKERVARELFQQLLPILIERT
jgi:phosphopantothenoylcysteine decarboxylase / phosphopantothenate---cysteine ligase